MAGEFMEAPCKFAKQTSVHQKYNVMQLDLRITIDENMKNNQGLIQRAVSEEMERMLVGKVSIIWEKRTEEDVKNNKIRGIGQIFVFNRDEIIALLETVSEPGECTVNTVHKVKKILGIE